MYECIYYNIRIRIYIYIYIYIYICAKLNIENTVACINNDIHDYVDCAFHASLYNTLVTDVYCNNICISMWF